MPGSGDYWGSRPNEHYEAWVARQTAKKNARILGSILTQMEQQREEAMRNWRSNVTQPATSYPEWWRRNRRVL